MLDIPRPRVLLFLWACCAAVAAPAAEKNEAATDAYTAASTAASTLVQAARLVTGVVDGVATLTPYQPPMDPVVTARNAELALASGRSAAYAVGNHSETSGKGPGERQTKALSAALVAAERAVVLALAAAHDAAAASKMAERARASAIEAQALAAEVVVFVAAAQTAGSDATSNAASRNADVSISSSNHDVVAWTSASLTDKWLVEEVGLRILGDGTRRREHCPFTSVFCSIYLCFLFKCWRCPLQITWCPIVRIFNISYSFYNSRSTPTAAATMLHRCISSTWVPTTG
jgi:hypothetical protein